MAMASASSWVALTNGGFFGVGQHLAVVQLAFGADAVFSPASPVSRLPRQPSSPSTVTPTVGHGHHLAGHVHVVVEGRRRLAVFHQRAVHHHRAEAQVRARLQTFGRGAVVLVHHQRDVRVHLGGGLDQVLDEGLAGVLAGTGAGLQDHRRADFVGGGHDGLHLLQVVDVEGGMP
jgi:hypothetical protein